MKRVSLIAILTAVMIMAASAMCFADDGLKLVSSYPEDGQKNTSIENLGVKLTFNHPINKPEVKKANLDKFAIYDEDGKAVPVEILFSDKNDGLVLVLADIDKGFTAKNNSEYRLVVSKGVVDNDGHELAKEQTVTFRTYNQRVNNIVNMVMMFVMFGGIMLISVRQNNMKEEEETPKDAPKEAAFNPYREAKRTGKTVDEVKAEQAKKEEKEAKKRARKKKKTEEPQEKKIENCAELLNNVYHVHAPAPISREDRSVEALAAMRKAEKAPKQAKTRSKGSKGNQRKK